jgi:hypothetical protein
VSHREQYRVVARAEWVGPWNLAMGDRELAIVPLETPRLRVNPPRGRGWRQASRFSIMFELMGKMLAGRRHVF